MAFIPVPDCVHIKIEGRVDNQTTINDLYFRSTIGPRSASDVNGLNNTIAGWYMTNMAPLLNEAWTGVKATARGLSNVVGFTAESSMLGSVGGVTGEAAPNNCSMAVSFRTGLAGRSNHGRNYVPCLTNSQVIGNTIDSDWANDVLGAYGLLIFPSVDIPSGWIWVVVSRFTGGAPRLTGTFQEIISVNVSDLIVDSMRTRLPGRGR